MDSEEAIPSTVMIRVNGICENKIILTNFPAALPLDRNIYSCHLSSHFWGQNAALRTARTVNGHGNLSSAPSHISDRDTDLITRCIGATATGSCSKYIEKAFEFIRDLGNQRPSGPSLILIRVDR